MVILYHRTSFGTTERSAGPYSLSAGAGSNDTGCCPPAGSFAMAAVLARGGDPPEPPDGLRPLQSGTSRSVLRARAARERVLPWLAERATPGTGPDGAGAGVVADRRPAAAGGPDGRRRTWSGRWSPADVRGADHHEGGGGPDRARNTGRATTASPSLWPCPGTTRARSSGRPRTSPARPRRALACDGHPAFGQDCSDDLDRTPARAVRGRAATTCATSAADAAAACKTALVRWRPGERDLDIQARCAAGLEAARRGHAGPDRRRRRPGPAVPPPDGGRRAGAAPRDGGGGRRRGGLHVAATRFASAGPLTRALRGRCAAGCSPDRGGRPGRIPARRTATGTRSARWTRVRGRGRARRLGRALPGRADRLRPARVRDRPGPGRFPLVPASRSQPGHAVAWNPSLPGRREGRGHLPGEAGGWSASPTGAGLAGRATTAGIRRAPLFWRCVR